ncbi:MAG: rhomboid family intramembrane serine protease [Armatimonadota bacterium]
MNFDEPRAEDIPVDPITLLVELQGELLTHGYSYDDADETTWPASPVLMSKGGQKLLILPWTPESDEHIRMMWADFRGSYGNSAGLLLVGSRDTQDAAVVQFFDNTRGPVAYIDAGAGLIRLRRPRAITATPPKILSEDALPILLEDARKHRTTPEACLHILHVQVQEARRIEAFRSATLRASGSAKPFITYALLGVCIFFFLGTMLTGYDPEHMSPALETLVQWGALSSELVVQGQWWRLLSYGLLHGGITHILFNMMALSIFGGLVEQWQGRWRFLAIMGFSTLTGGLLALWWTPGSVMVGISGAIFGLLGTLIALLLRFKSDIPPDVYSGLRQWLVKLLGINLVISLLPGISLAGHLGGLLGGLLFTLAIGRSPMKNTSPTWGSLLALVVLLLLTVTGGAFIIHRLSSL